MSGWGRWVGGLTRGWGGGWVGGCVGGGSPSGAARSCWRHSFWVGRRACHACAVCGRLLLRLSSPSSPPLHCSRLSSNCRQMVRMWSITASLERKHYRSNMCVRRPRCRRFRLSLSVSVSIFPPPPPPLSLCRSHSPTLSVSVSVSVSLSLSLSLSQPPVCRLVDDRWLALCVKFFRHARAWWSQRCCGPADHAGQCRVVDVVNIRVVGLSVWQSLSDVVVVRCCGCCVFITSVHGCVCAYACVNA
jgi:hypothetical protein